MSKVLRVEMDAGVVWDIPAELIAHARASYFEERDPDTTYQKEYEYTIGSDFELLDWAGNSMNWADVEPHARLVPTEPIHMDMEREWSRAHMEILED